jgi:hypothetical protein
MNVYINVLRLIILQNLILIFYGVFYTIQYILIHSKNTIKFKQILLNGTLHKFRIL